MPHINAEQKMKYMYLKQTIDNIEIETKGDLEYLVYQLMKAYMKTRNRRYATLHDAVYATLHSAQEFKRLHLDKREDEAIEENGEA
jgi:hypothetical protein